MSKLLRSLFLSSLMACFFAVPMVYGVTYTLDTATPSGTDSPTEGDDRIRELKSAFVERFQVEHTFPASGTTYDGATVGYHKLLRLPEQGSAPSTPAGYGAIYTKDSGTQPEAFFREESNGDEVQLTSGGKVVVGTIVTGDLPDGAVAQMVNKQDATASTHTTAIPYDNTVPQITEGEEVMTLAVTPNASTNELRVDVVVFASNTATGGSINVALFNTDFHATNAAAAGTSRNFADNARMVPIPFTFYCLASDLNDTTATTFRVRIGGGTGATTTWNGESGSGKLGGVAYSSITITEIVAS